MAHLAEFLANLERNDEALYYWSQAAEIDAAYLPRYAQQAAAMGKKEAADEAFSRAIAEDPANQSLHYLKGQYLESQQDWERARGAYEDAFHRVPTFAALQAAAMMCGRLGKTDHLLSLVESAAHNLPEEVVRIWNLAGIKLYEAERYIQAAEYYQKALAKSPENGTLLRNLALVRNAQKKYQEAEDLFERAVAAAPQDPRSWLGYAEFYEIASRPDLATGVIERGLQRSPQDRDLRTHLAKLMSNDKISCHKIGDRLETWNTEDPGHPPYLRYKGICAMTQGDASAALITFLRELQVNRNDASAYYNLGLAYKVLGESGRARGAFAIATFLKPTDAAYAAEFRGLGLFSPIVPDVVPEGFWRATTEWAPYSQTRPVSPQIVSTPSGQFNGLTIAGGLLASLGVVSSSVAYFATDELDHPAVYLSLGATGIGTAMMIWGWNSPQTSITVAPTEGGALATYQTNF